MAAGSGSHTVSLPSCRVHPLTASSDGTWTVVAKRRRSPTSVLQGSQRAGQKATQPDNGRKEPVRPTQRTTRAQRRRQSQPQPQPKPTPAPAPKPAPKLTPAPAPKPAPKQPAVAAKLQASYKETLLFAATGRPAAAVPEPKELPPQQSRPSASNQVAGKSTGAALPHQQAEVHLVPL